MNAEGPGPGSIYEQLCGELLTDPDRLLAEITAGIEEIRALRATPPPRPVPSHRRRPRPAPPAPATVTMPAVPPPPVNLTKEPT